MSIKVALIQYELKNIQSYSETCTRFKEHLLQAKKNGCNLICFPECFWFGSEEYYKSNQVIKNITYLKNEALNFISEAAKEFEINIIAGTFNEQVQDKVLNTSYVFDSYGKQIYKYSKSKLVPYGYEYKNISPGTERSKVFEIYGTKIGITICRELFYPELYNDLRNQGAEIIFVLSWWSKRADEYLENKLINRYSKISVMKVVDALCQARAFENEAAVCYVNCSGNLKASQKFDILLGRTQVCIPFYGCINKLNKNREGMIIYEHNNSIITDARNSYKIFN